MELYKKISVDLYNPYPLAILKAKQGDTARGAMITLTAGGAVLVPTTERVRTYAKKPDGTKLYNDCEIENGKVRLKFTNQLLAVPGQLPVEIEMTNGDAILSTPIFMIQVLPTNIDSQAVESSDEFTALQSALQKAENAEGIAKEAADNAAKEAKAAEEAGERADEAARLASAAAAGADTARNNANTAATKAQTVADTVQKKLDNGDFIGPQGKPGVSVENVTDFYMVSPNATGVTAQTSGGRNFAYGTSFSNSPNAVDGYGDNKAIVFNYNGWESGSRRFIVESTSYMEDRVRAGEIYTISGWVYIYDDIPIIYPDNTTVFYRFTSNEGMFDIAFSLDSVKNIRNEWVFVSNTVNVTRDALAKSKSLEIAGYDGHFLVSSVKVEKGDKATDWTPAPEDLGWSTDVPTMTATNKYLWNYEHTTGSDDSTLSITNPRVIGVYGDKGDTGSTGATGPQGVRGSNWYNGTAITGTSTTGTIFSGSGISDAKIFDQYLNTSTGNTYRCTVAGAASKAKWIYTGCIKGAKGDKGDTGSVENVSQSAINFTEGTTYQKPVTGQSLGDILGKTVGNVDGLRSETQSQIGTLSSLSTAEKGSLVGAVNELNNKITYCRIIQSQVQTISVDFSYLAFDNDDNALVSVSSGVIHFKKAGIYLIDTDAVFYGLENGENITMTWNTSTSTIVYRWNAIQGEYNTFKMSQIYNITEEDSLAIAVFRNGTDKTLHQSQMKILKIA